MLRAGNSNLAFAKTHCTALYQKSFRGLLGVQEAIERRFSSFFELGVGFCINEVAVCAKTKPGKRNPNISRVRRLAATP